MDPEEVNVHLLRVLGDEDDEQEAGEAKPPLLVVALPLEGLELVAVGHGATLIHSAPADIGLVTAPGDG